MFSASGAKKLTDYKPNELFFDAEIEAYFDAQAVLAEFQKLRSFYCVICDAKGTSTKRSPVVSVYCCLLSLSALSHLANTIRCSCLLAACWAARVFCWLGRSLLFDSISRCFPSRGRFASLKQLSGHLEQVHSRYLWSDFSVHFIYISPNFVFGSALSSRFRLVCSEACVAARQVFIHERATYTQVCHRKSVCFLSVFVAFFWPNRPLWTHFFLCALNFAKSTEIISISGELDGPLQGQGKRGPGPR